MEELILTLELTLNRWTQQAIAFVPRLLLAVVVYLAFYLLYRLLRHPIQRLTLRTIGYESIANMLGGLLSRGIQIVGFFSALKILGLDTAVATLIGGLGLLGLGLSFAFQDIATNFIAGIILMVQRPFRVGDFIDTNGFLGTVRKIELRSTILETIQGPLVSVPNRDVFLSAFTNYSDIDKRRVDVPVGVSYGEDLRKVNEIVLRTLEQVPDRDPEKDVGMFHTGFGESSIDFTAYVWIDIRKGTGLLPVRDEIIIRLKEAFDREGITIPFPTRTVEQASIPQS